MTFHRHMKACIGMLSSPNRCEMHPGLAASAPDVARQCGESRDLPSQAGLAAARGRRCRRCRSALPAWRPPVQESLHQLLQQPGLALQYFEWDTLVPGKALPAASPLQTQQAINAAD